MRAKCFRVLGGALLLLAGILVLPTGSATAQLMECDQVDQNGNVAEAGGCIARTLQDQIGAGHGDVNTPGSAVYLIKRDPGRSVRRGRQLFQRKFTAAEGHGPRVNFTSTGDITQSRALGAGLADSCAACHGRPRGSAGVGGDVNTFPDSRDAPHLFGLGIVEQLGEEMTADLRAIRDNAINVAQIRQRSVTRRLRTKGVNFGFIKAFPNGTVDTSRVEGVDPDLRVKPFFHDGRTASMREFIIGALNDEMGLQAWDPVLCAATDPISPQVVTSPAGFVFDPNTDTIARPPACSASDDPDGDGVAGEIDPALVDHLEFYLLNYFKPGQYEVTNRDRQGDALLDDIGCTTCHVRDMVIDSDRRVADVETVFDPVNGIFNDLFATASTRFGDPIVDGDPFPQLPPSQAPFVVRNFFSDLKRHNLGPNFAERDFDGSRITEHVTEPLWGAGTPAPYGHDGRSINLDQVIRRHGGEAQAARDAYVALSRGDQRRIREFISTLILFPPDDTASNLNPGDPNGDPQVPGNHGNINLGALFQIPSEGPE